MPSASPGEAVDLLARVRDVNPLTRRDALLDLGWLVVSAIGVGYVVVMTRAMSSGETPSAPILLALFAAFALGVVILWLKPANARIPLMWLPMPVMALLVAPAFLPAVWQTPVPVLMVLFAAAIGTPIVLLARRLPSTTPALRPVTFPRGWEPLAVAAVLDHAAVRPARIAEVLDMPASTAAHWVDHLTELDVVAAEQARRVQLTPQGREWLEAQVAALRAATGSAGTLT